MTIRRKENCYSSIWKTVPKDRLQNALQRFIPIDTHCIRFALLHSQDENFKPHHDHKHQDVCEQCLSLFLTIEAVEKPAVATDDIELRQELLFCPIMGCTASFESKAELLQHNLSGSHQTVEIRSSMDEVKSYYAELIQASSNLHHDVSTEL